MNLSDILSQAASGGGLQSLGKQFGLNPQQTQSAVDALLPAFSRGLRDQASTPTGLGGLLSTLAGGQANQYGDDVEAAASKQGVDDGNSILGQLFGSKDVSRAVAAQASQASGISADTLKKMLPSLASVLMGALANKSNAQVRDGTFGSDNPLGQILGQVLGGAQGQQTAQAAPSGGLGGGLGDILGQILGGGAQAQQAPRGRAQQSDNPLGDILGQILGGAQGQAAPQRGAPAGDNPLGDILGQILGGAQGGSQGQAAPQSGAQQGNNPLGDILGQILGGGSAGQSADYDEPQPRAQSRRAQPQPNQGGSLGDILGKMFNPGTQPAAQDDNYQQGVDNIFDQFRKGMDRQR